MCKEKHDTCIKYVFLKHDTYSIIHRRKVNKFILSKIENCWLFDRYCFDNKETSYNLGKKYWSTYKYWSTIYIKQHTYIKQKICNRVCKGLKKSAWFINRQNMWRGTSTNTACDNTYTGTWCCLNLSRNTFKPLQQECKITSPGHVMG